MGTSGGRYRRLLLQHALRARLEFDAASASPHASTAHCPAWVFADFPLSRALRCPQSHGEGPGEASQPAITLSSAHLQLAAQVPSEWTRSERSLEDARFALRKVVWRALIEEPLQKHSSKTAGASNADRRLDACDAGDGNPSAGVAQGGRPTKRLGRLNDAAYASWDSFVATVRTKLELEDADALRVDPELASRVEVFHVLRCIVGPVIESLILLDRLAWLTEELHVRSHRLVLHPGVHQHNRVCLTTPNWSISSIRRQAVGGMWGSLYAMSKARRVHSQICEIRKELQKRSNPFISPTTMYCTDGTIVTAFAMNGA